MHHNIADQLIITVILCLLSLGVVEAGLNTVHPCSLETGFMDAAKFEPYSAGGICTPLQRLHRRSKTTAISTPIPSVPLPRGCLPTINDFFLKEKLGQGSQATVWLVEHRDTGAHYALKIIDKRQTRLDGLEASVSFEQEVMVFLTGSAPHFVTLYASFQDEESLYLVMVSYLAGIRLLPLLLLIICMLTGLPN